MDGLSEEEFYKKKNALMRKLTQKNTKFLYEKKPTKPGTSLRELAAKKEHEEKMNRARTKQSTMSMPDGSGNVTPREKTSSMSVSRKSTMEVTKRLSSNLNTSALSNFSKRKRSGLSSVKDDENESVASYNGSRTDK